MLIFWIISTDILLEIYNLAIVLKLFVNGVLTKQKTKFSYVHVTRWAFFVSLVGREY